MISKITKLLNSVENSDLQLNKIILTMSLKKLKTKLSIQYHEFLNMFNKKKIIHLFLHQLYKHKIELKDKN